MNKLALATGVALVALTGSAYAADLIITEPAPVVVAPAASSAGVYFELLGGAALGGTVDTTDALAGAGTYDVNAGWAGAAVIGFGTGLEGLSVEGDFFLSQREIDGTTTAEVLTTGSAMANLRYTVSLNDVVGVYGAVGLGGVFLHDEDEAGLTLVDNWGLGYQVKAGVTAAVTENISLVGEVRYTNTFDAIEGEVDGTAFQTGTTAVLAGIHFGF